MPFVSIVVPVYQAKNHLNRCIKSIVSQEFRDFEVILVDDGSTDGCAELCDFWADKDERIKVMHKKNEGVSVARNIGIQQAKGTYIQFVDSDDWLERNYTGKLVEVAEKTNCDLVLAGYSIQNGYGVREIYIDKCIGKYDEEIPVSQVASLFGKLYRGQMLNSPWNKLYKKIHIQRGFPKGIKLGEDFIFNMRYLLNIKSITMSSATGYCYDRTNENSATARLGYYKDEDFLEYCKSAEDFLLQYFSPEQIKSDMDRMVYDQFCGYLTRLAINKKFWDACIELKNLLMEPHVHSAVLHLDTKKTTLGKKYIRSFLRLRCVGLAIFAVKAKNCYRGLHNKNKMNKIGCTDGV